jgi:hypothetical protein
MVEQEKNAIIEIFISVLKTTYVPFSGIRG